MTTVVTQKLSDKFHWQGWALGIIRGQSQIFFQANPLTAIAILAAFFVADWQMGIMAFLGAVGGALGGWMARYSTQAISLGLLSFCGSLVGAAIFAAYGGSLWWSYLLALGGGVLTVPVTWLIEELFATRALAKFELPYTTAPFVIVAAALAVWAPEQSVTVALSQQEPLMAVGRSLLTNVSQVVLINDPWSGGLILLGLFLAGPRIGLSALVGSGFGTLMGVALGLDWNWIGDGMVGYSGVLTMLAVSVTFIRSTVASWAYALPWVLVTAIVTLIMQNTVTFVYTWPFILTTWTALLVAYFFRDKLVRS